MLSALRRSDNENMLSTMNLILMCQKDQYFFSWEIFSQEYTSKLNLSGSPERSVKVLKLKNFKKDAPCQAFKNQERHRLKGESSPSQRLKGESSPSPLLISTCRKSQTSVDRAFIREFVEE
ncbi:hypothetical protein Tco_0393828 [Tanacetum coccineum]